MRANNHYTFDINFRSISPICGVFIPVRAHSGTPPYDYMFNTAGGQEIERRALALLPAPDIWGYYMKDPVEEYQWEAAKYGPYELDGDEWKIVNSLWWTDQFSDDPDECDDAGARTHYIGMVQAGPGDNGFNGIGNVGGDQMVFRLALDSPGSANGVEINTPRGGRSLAHELGHNYDLEHTGCTTGDDEPSYPYDNCHFADPTGDQRTDWYGFDVTRLASIAPPVGAAKLGDLMSYSDVRWTSDWTWRDIFTQLFVQDARDLEGLRSIFQVGRDAATDEDRPATGVEPSGGLAHTRTQPAEASTPAGGLARTRTQPAEASTPAGGLARTRTQPAEASIPAGGLARTRTQPAEASIPAGGLARTRTQPAEASTPAGGLARQRTQPAEASTPAGGLARTRTQPAEASIPAGGLARTRTQPAEASTPAGAAISQAETASVLLATGYANVTTGEYGLERLLVTDPAWLPASKLAEISLAITSTGNWALRLLDAGDNPLGDYAFAPQRLSGDTADWSFFGVAAPWPANAAGVQLVADGAVRATQRVSSHAPTVQITAPNGGESFDGDFTIAWDAEDADDDVLRYTIQYSADNGAAWTVLRSEYPTRTLTVEAGAVAGSAGQALVRVIASDGLSSASDQSDAPFSVGKHAPQATILTPDGSIFPPDRPILLRGTAFDREDGRLAGAALRWRLDLLGEVGSGETLDLFAMPRERYLVTLTATDSDGQTGSAAITVQVGYAVRFLPVVLR